jgi:hypothetical protein
LWASRRKTLEILQRPIGRVHPGIIGDVVPVVFEWGWAEGQNPDGRDAEVLEIIQFLGQAPEVSHPIPVAVRERPHVELVDDPVRLYRSEASSPAGRARRSPPRGVTVAAEAEHVCRRAAVRVEVTIVPAAVPPVGAAAELVDDVERLVAPIPREWRCRWTKQERRRRGSRFTTTRTMS